MLCRASQVSQQNVAKCVRLNRCSSALCLAQRKYEIVLETDDAMPFNRMHRNAFLTCIDRVWSCPVSTNQMLRFSPPFSLSPPPCLLSCDSLSPYLLLSTFSAASFKFSCCDRAPPPPFAGKLYLPRFLNHCFTAVAVQIFSI